MSKSKRISPQLREIEPTNGNGIIFESSGGPYALLAHAVMPDHYLMLSANELSVIVREGSRALGLPDLAALQRRVEEMEAGVRALIAACLSCEGKGRKRSSLMPSKMIDCMDCRKLRDILEGKSNG